MPILSNAIAKQCWCYRVLLKPRGRQNGEKLNKSKNISPKPVPRAAAAYGRQLKTPKESNCNDMKFKVGIIS